MNKNYYLVMLYFSSSFKSTAKIIFCAILVINIINAAHASDKPVKPPRCPVPDKINLKAANTAIVYDLVVIGGGAAGSMAANRAVLNNDKVLFVVGNRKSESQARGMWVPQLNNTPTFYNTNKPIVAMRDEMLENISRGFFKENMHVLQDSIESIAKVDNIFIFKSFAGEVFKAKYVILATGIMDVQPNIGGAISKIFPFANRSQAIYCSRCDGHLVADKKYPSIIGYSNNAVDNAILLIERYGLTNLNIFTNGAIPIWDKEKYALINKYNINVYDKKIIDISDRKNKILSSVTLDGGDEVLVDFILVNLGVRINNKLAVELGASLDNDGFVIADQDGLTTVDNLYVAGDLKSGTRKQVYTSWDSAIRAAESINFKLRQAKNN